MTPATECYPLHAHQPPSAAWTRRLLARLSDLFRQRLSRIDPAELPPHLLRDLGLADQGFVREREARLMDWRGR